MTNELYINDVQIDINTEIDFPLSYSIADLKNPQKRRRNFSKTIKLPATKKNCYFFHSAYDPHAYDRNNAGFGFEFDPTIRYKCRSTRNGATIFNGAANLESTEMKDGKPHAFNVTLYSAFTNIIQDLGDIMISELGWSDYDHTLSIANIQASWTAVTGSGYVYPYIDYGFAMDPRAVKTNELRPYVYFKEVLEKCFEHAGYSVSSVFINTALFQKFIIGYGGGDPIDLSSAEVAERQTNYTGDGSKDYGDLARVFPVSATRWAYAYNIYEPIADSSDITMTLVDDDLVQWDGEEIIIANSGNYNLTVSADIDFTYAMSESGFLVKFYVRLEFLKNGAWVSGQQLNVYDNFSGTSTLNFNHTQDFDLNSGDILSVRMNINTLGTESNFSDALALDWDLNNTLSMNLTAINSGLIDGDTVQLARHIPKMKAADFVKDCITMFNLYMDEPDEEDRILVETFDTFYYDTDDTDNWTDKKDHSQVSTIRPAATIEGKTYSFTFAQDRDYYKNRYFEQYGIDYGDYNYNVPSTFKKGMKEYKLKVAQSVPVQLEGTDIIIPRILKYDEGTGVTSPHKGKPRVFIYNGVVSSDSWQLINSDTLAPTTFTDYPLVHHVDSLTSPTFDLNFGRPEIVFYVATTYPTNNLFFEHHAQLIRELTGRDSKIKVAHFNLNESDFYKGFQRRVANINGSLWRKNIIHDFSATKEQTTKVELIRIVAAKSRKDFQTALPELPTLPIDNTQGGDDPFTSDQTARSNLTYYPFDASGGDVTLSLDPDFLQSGKAIEVKKVSQGGKVILQTVGQGIEIDGQTEIWITGYNDSLTVLWDGEKFNIV